MAKELKKLNKNLVKIYLSKILKPSQASNFV
jgi:hypothetical protein